VLYELFHDVLAQAALNWRRKYVAVQEQQLIRREEEVARLKEKEEAERRREREKSRVLRAAIGVLSLVLVVIAGLLALTVWQTRKARRANAQISAKNTELNDKNQEIIKKNNELQAEQHLRKGTALARKLRLDEAISEYDQAIALNPAIPEAYSYKGYALIRQKKYSEAISTLEGLTSRNPDYSWGHYNLALAYWNNGNNKQAIAESLKLLDMDASFCDTFRKDPAYKWVKTEPEIRDRCGYEPDETTPTSPDTTLPGE
jgi:tetratricopeptide (TPR) repeat protein